MRTNIIRIGNSQGILIPKKLLEESGLGTEVELEIVNEKIVIRSVGRPRAGWAEKFKLMSENGSDKVIDEDLN